MRAAVPDWYGWWRRPPGGEARWAPWAYAFAITWWASSWTLRSSPLMAWCPVEPVLLGALAIAACLVHRCSRPLRLSARVFWPLLLVVVTFIPGALLSDQDGYGPAKMTDLAFVMLPVTCASAVLLDTARARVCWCWSQVVAGACVAVAAIITRDPSSMLVLERVVLPTTDTIATARMIGAAVVTLLVFGLAAPRRHWWAWPVALAMGTVLMQVGSRGPALAVVVTLFVVIVVGRGLAGRRMRPLVLAGIVSVIGYVYAVSGGGVGGQRIVDSVQGGLEDDARRRLLDDASDLGFSHLLGVGWGDFARHSTVGQQIADGQGRSYAHNAFAEVFAEAGILALLGFATLVVLALVRLQRSSDTGAGMIMLAMATYWLLNAQVSRDLVGNRFMWIALACGLAAVASDLHRPKPSGDHADAAMTSRGGQRA